MPTALDLISAAMRHIKVIDPDEEPGNSEAQDGLSDLNAMLDSWWNESLAVYQLLQENFSLPSGVSSRTIGTGAQFNTTRPVRIVSAFARLSNVDYPIDVIQAEEYDSIQDKTVTGPPDKLFYDPAYPTGTIYFYPVPDVAYTLYIRTYKRLQSFTNLTTDLSLPPGYQSAIEWNLALEIWDDYKSGDPPGNAVRKAAMYKWNLKRINKRSFPVAVEVASMNRPGFNILRGD